MKSEKMPKEINWTEVYKDYMRGESVTAIAKRHNLDMSNRAQNLYYQAAARGWRKEKEDLHSKIVEELKAEHFEVKKKLLESANIFLTELLKNGKLPDDLTTPTLDKFSAGNSAFNTFFSNIVKIAASESDRLDRIETGTQPIQFVIKRMEDDHREAPTSETP